MKKRALRIASFILLGVFAAGLVMMSRPIVSRAFDSNDYSYDSGGSDWGGSDWSSGSDWDYSSSSYDYDSGGYSSSGGSGGFGLLSALLTMFGMSPGIAIFIAIVIISNILRRRRNSGSNLSSAQPRQETPVRRQAPLAHLNIPNRNDEIGRIITKRDPNFTVPDFLTFGKNVYMNIQDAWCKRDLEPVRAIFHQNLYERTMTQIQKKKEAGIIQHLERLTANEAYLTSYRRDANYEYVKMYMNSSMIDYQVDEKTGKVVYGDTTTRWTMRYELIFMRSVKAKTPAAGASEIGISCPNCGAPLKGTSFGKCIYCDSLVTTGLYNWVLSDFNAIKDSFHDDGIQIQGEE